MLAKMANMDVNYGDCLDIVVVGLRAEQAGSCVGVGVGVGVETL